MKNTIIQTNCNMSHTRFKLGNKVRVADFYRLDEVAQHINTSEVAIIRSEPSDDEELVCIAYESGEIDFVPQEILEVINGKWVCYDRNHMMNTESGMIVINEADLDNPLPKEIKGFDMLF